MAGMCDILNKLTVMICGFDLKRKYDTCLKCIMRVDLVAM